MLLLGHWPALVGTDARLFKLRPVAGIDGSSLMGHRVAPCAFSPITLVDSAIPIISIFQMAEHLIGGVVVEAVSLARCAQRGSRSHGRRRFRFCARRTGYAACTRRMDFVACDRPSVIGYWLALFARSGLRRDGAGLKSAKYRRKCPIPPRSEMV